MQFTGMEWNVLIQPLQLVCLPGYHLGKSVNSCGTRTFGSIFNHEKQLRRKKDCIAEAI